MFGIIKNVAKHSIIYGLSDILSRSVGFFMIPLYTHYLTPTDYGTLEILDLVSYIIGLFLAMGINQAVFRIYYDYDDEAKRKQVISVAMISLWAVSFVVLTALLSFSEQISNLVFSSEGYSRMLSIVFVSLVIQLSNQIPLGLIRIQEKSVLYVVFNTVKLVTVLSLNILFIVHYGMGVMGILLSSLIVAAAAGVFLLIYTLRQVPLSYSREILFAMLKYSLPLMWSWFGMFVLNYGDRFFLQRLLSLHEVGIYSLSYKFGFLPNVLVLTPFLMIWAPKRFELMKETNAREIYSVIFTYFMFAELFIGLGIAVLIKDVISIVADAKFHDAHRYVKVILVGYILYGVYQYVQFGVHVEKKTKLLAYATLFGAGINVVMNFFLIPIIDVWGAALATFVAMLFLVIYIYIPSQRFYHTPYEFSRLARMCATALGLYFAADLITLDSLALSVTVKFLIALSFPLVLYLVKFYTPEELEKMARLRHQIREAVKVRMGSSNKAGT